MLNFLISLLGVLITIFLVVGIHEFGHFIVARMLNVKVLRFSIGFGKAFYRWHDKKGTEYVLAPIPLGGYVKMLDETEEAVPPEELPYAYNRQPIYKKAAIVLAGPLFNLIFAIFLYWILFVVGFTTIVPLIGKVTPNSIAYHAGLQPKDEIVQVNNQETRSWTAVIMRLLVYVGDDTNISVTTRTAQSNTLEQHSLILTHWHLNELKPDPLGSLGIEPYQPTIPPIIGSIKPNTPASSANLKPKDRILAIDGKPMQSWYQVLEQINTQPEKTLKFSIERTGKKIEIPVTIGYTTDLFFQKSGFLGIMPEFSFPKELLRNNQYSPLKAIQYAFKNTIEFTQLNFLLLGKMLTGKLSFQSLGGPITIFETAGTAFAIGIIPFISFLAFLSIAIGIINILPIPGLDGGHLLFHIIEVVLRRPLSPPIQMLFYRLGLIILLILVMQALANDIMRL